MEINMREVHKFTYEPETDEELAAFQIVHNLVDAGHQAYIVGGAVRDRYMSRELGEDEVKPHDVDVATSATPAQVQSVFEKTVAVGISFGVVRVVLDGVETEVATFRSENGYSDGRHPDNVELVSDPEVDASRRDFTINALFYDVYNEEIIDFFGGINDLHRKKLRTVGNPDDRFNEDKLRMMRAARFAARFEMTLDETVFAAMCRHAEEIKVVSPERIFMELTKIIGTCNHAGEAMSVLLRTGILEHILPDVAKYPEVEQGRTHHPEGHVWNHVMKMLGMCICHADPLYHSPELHWGILLHDVAKLETHERDPETGRHKFHRHAELGVEKAYRILEGFNCSNEFIDKVVWLVGQHMNMMQVQSMKRSTLRRLLGDPRFELLLRLHEMDSLGSHGDCGNVDFLRDKQEQFANEPILPDPLTSGYAVMSRGVERGPMIGIIMRELRELQLNDEIVDYDAAMTWLDRRCRLAIDEVET